MGLSRRSWALLGLVVLGSLALSGGWAFRALLKGGPLVFTEEVRFDVPMRFDAWYPAPFRPILRPGLAPEELRVYSTRGGDWGALTQRGAGGDRGALVSALAAELKAAGWTEAADLGPPPEAAVEFLGLAEDQQADDDLRLKHDPVPDRDPLWYALRVNVSEDGARVTAVCVNMR